MDRIKLVQEKWIWAFIICFLSFWVDKVSSFCPTHCSCNLSTLRVNCTEANLKIIPIFLNPETKFLSLTQNKIIEIGMELQFYSQLQLLDISQNQLLSLGNTSFENLAKLRVLNASYNGVRKLDADTFNGLKQLVVLDLSVNQIEILDLASFRGLVSLKELYLDRNRIETFDWNLFLELSSLQILSLKFNFVRVLEPPARIIEFLSQINMSESGGGAKVLPSKIKDLHKLEELDLRWNQLTRIKNYAISVAPNLQSLDLSCNYIHTIESKSFQPLPTEKSQLKSLSLKQNKVNLIPTEALEPLGQTLQELDLSSNRLNDEVGPNSFRSLFQLRTLKISQNPGINSIHPNALLDNIHLVNFEANHLSNMSAFPVGLFNNKAHLASFSLQYARISTLPAELFANPTYASLLSSLDLYGNPLDCNCSVYELYEYIRALGDARSDREALSLTRDPSSHLILKVANFTDTTTMASNFYPTPSPPEPYQKVSLKNIYCYSPPHLNQIQLKDIGSTEFGHCFTHSLSISNEYFELLVILLAAVIVTLIILVIGIKLCCIYHICGKCSKLLEKQNKNKESNHPCPTSLDEFCSNVGIETKPNNNGPNSGEYSIPFQLTPSQNKTHNTLTHFPNSPHHQRKLGLPPAMEPCGNSNNANIFSPGRYATTRAGLAYNNTGSIRPRIPLHLDYEGYSQYPLHGPIHITPNPNNNPTGTFNHKLRLNPKMQLVLDDGTNSESGEDEEQPNNHHFARSHQYLPHPQFHRHNNAEPNEPPPMILHYEFNYPDYRNTRQRTKQVPSVLV